MLAALPGEVLSRDVPFREKLRRMYGSNDWPARTAERGRSGDLTGEGGLEHQCDGGTVRHDGGSLTRTNTLSVSQAGTWVGGSVVGKGKLIVGQNAPFDISGSEEKLIDGYAFRNLGTVSWLGAI